MATQFEKLMKDAEFKAAVTTLQTETFDLSDTQQYYRFMNAIAVVVNKGFAEGYDHGIADFAGSIRRLRHTAPREGVMPIAHRSFELSIQPQSTTEHPDMPLEMELEYLQLGSLSYSQLIRAGIRTVGDLTSKTGEEISSIMATSENPAKDVADVRKCLAQYGYVLSGDTTIMHSV